MSDRPDLELVVWSGASMRTYRLPPRGRVTLGRADDVHIRIEDASLSRHHAAIHVGSFLEIEDLGSRNGTRLRTGRDVDPAHASQDTTDLIDGRLRAHERARIAIGQTVILGAVAIVVRPVAPSEESVSATDRAVVTNPAMRALYELAERVARSGLSVLVLGETGTGKEVLAETIHLASPRATRPLVRLNCAALTETLLESELFGHERGAFTGAVGTKKGLLETADGGTVFLDEIGELPLTTQAKLLRVLEDRTLLRVGGVKTLEIDVRFIAATHRDLHQDVERGAFRRDLLFRLEGITLVLPPLRDRVDEIEPLASLFARKAASALGRRDPPAFTHEAIDALMAHSWPGNIRELRNVIDRAVVLADGPIRAIDLHLSPARPSKRPPEPAATSSDRPRALGEVRDELATLERKRVIDALEQCGGNQTRAAALLGISRRTLVSRLEQYELPRPRKGRE